VIKFTNVFKAFPKGGLALKDVSFHIAKGEFVFLTGHSGAGKSTVLKLVYADEPVTSGEVRVSGFNAAELRPRDVPMLRRRLGIVFQDFRLLEDRTAEENVAFALEVTGARRSSIPARVMRVLTQVGLAAKAQAYPRELSGGEQQRVAIARALVNEPSVLLADEPTGNLDERATRGVFQLLRDINASGTAVVMATHDLDLVRQAPYRVIELQEGRWCTTRPWTSPATRRRRREPDGSRSPARLPTRPVALGAVGHDHRVLAVRGRPVRARGREPAGRAAGRGRASGDRGLPPARHADRIHYARRKGHRGVPRSALGRLRERGLGAGAGAGRARRVPRRVAGARAQSPPRLHRGEAQAQVPRCRARERRRRPAARVRVRGRRAVRARLGGEARPPAPDRRRGGPR